MRKGVPREGLTFLSTDGLEDREGDIDVRVLLSPPAPLLPPTGETAPRAPPRLTRGPRGPRGPPGPPGGSLTELFRWSEARAAATRPLGDLTGEVEREDDVPPEAVLPRRPTGVKFAVVEGTVDVRDGVGSGGGAGTETVAEYSGGGDAEASVSGGVDPPRTGAEVGASGSGAGEATRRFS